MPEGTIITSGTLAILEESSAVTWFLFSCYTYSSVTTPLLVSVLTVAIASILFDATGLELGFNYFDKLGIGLFNDFRF